MRKQPLFYFAIALVLTVSTLAQATTVQRLSLEDMTKKASSIVVGKVKDSRAFWSGKLILTTTTIDVTETIKGQTSRSIQLTTVGGTVGDTTLQVSGMPAFQAGEDAVVFVERSGSFSTVVGLTQGKFVVDRGEVMNSVTDLQFPDGKSGTPLKMPLSTFKKQIELFLATRP